MPRRNPDGTPPPRASPHSVAAAKSVLDTLARAGKPASSVHEAVQLGYLTMLDWCDVLDTYRELYKVGKPHPSTPTPHEATP